MVVKPGSQSGNQTLSNGMLKSPDNYLFDAQQFPWFSPPKIAIAYSQLIKKYGEDVLTNTRFQKAKEAGSVALLLLAMNKIFGEHYLLQVSDDESPDVRSVILKEIPGQPIHGFFQEVEVVHFEEHSKETDVVDFLKTTKLSKKKSYDELTIILCHIQKNIDIPPIEHLRRRIAELSPKPQIYLLGKVIEPEKYLVTQLWKETWPDFVIDMLEQVTKYPRRPSILWLTKSSSKTLNFRPYTGRKPTLEEIFHLK